MEKASASEQCMNYAVVVMLTCVRGRGVERTLGNRLACAFALNNALEYGASCDA